MIKNATIELTTFRVFEPLLAPARYKGAHGGRGSGKSHFFAEMVVERALLTPGLRVVCIREVQKSLEQSVKALIESKIRAMGVTHLFEIRRYEIRTPGDGIIIFQGMQAHTADSIKSLEGYDIAWVEEAQSLSQYSLDLLRPTIRKPGSELWFSFNPLHETDPVDMLLRGANKPDDAIVVEANYYDNPFLPDVLKKEIEWDRRRDPDRFAWVWKGQYRKLSEARVFKNWREDVLEVPSYAKCYYGADFGFSVDPSTLVRVWMWDRTLYVDFEAYEVGVEVDHLPKFYEKVPGSQQHQIVADSARPETISYLNRHGYEVVPAVKGKDSVEEGVTFLQSHDIVVNPRCTHTIDELTFYAYKTDRVTGAVLPDLLDANNHIIDALRYALESARTAFDAERWVKAYS